MSEKITERDMLNALGHRYTSDAGNGDRWIRAEHVRNGTGFYGYDRISGRCVTFLRTADFIALDGWESKKHVVHGHEVKVSRSDWLTELKDPEKAEAFRPRLLVARCLGRLDRPRGRTAEGLGAHGPPLERLASSRPPSAAERARPAALTHGRGADPRSSEDRDARDPARTPGGGGVKCKHCSRFIEPAAERLDGCRHRHLDGWRSCAFNSDTFAEPEDPTPEAQTEEAPF